jgi:formamidase
VATHEIRIDAHVPLRDEREAGHNRWHPDIRPRVRCAPGDEVILETRDALDGQITADSGVDDVANCNLSVVHPLTGPVHVEGAAPGDLLVVDVLDVEAPSFGFTVQIPGFGFLRDDFPDPYIVRWEISDGWAASDDLPGVSIPGSPFFGTFGVAPSQQLVADATAREQDLIDRGGLALPPDATDAVPADDAIAAEALRTVPPRENVGNVDIKQTGAGTRCLLPVWVDGALFSAGDAHFAQGDGEVCGTAVEIRATGRFRFDLRKGEADERGIRSLHYSREGHFLPPSFSAPERFYATTGFSVDADGTNHSEDVTVATRNALLAMIDHLVAEYGYDRQQAYALTSVAVDLKISELPDAPNMLVSAFLPLDIFT